MDWAKIKTEYITTDTSYRELGEKYGVHYQTICARAKKEGWIREREQHRNRTITNSVKDIEKKKSKQAVKVCALADKLLAKLEQSIDEFDLTQTTRRVKTVYGNEEETTEFSLRQLTAALRDLQAIKGEITALERREREARIAALQRQEKSEDDNSAIEVLFSVGPEEWNE